MDVGCNFTAAVGSPRLFFVCVLLKGNYLLVWKIKAELFHSRRFGISYQMKHNVTN